MKENENSKNPSYTNPPKKRKKERKTLSRSISHKQYWQDIKTQNQKPPKNISIYLFIFLIYVSVRASLRAPRLIPRPTEYPTNPVSM